MVRLPRAALIFSVKLEAMPSAEGEDEEHDIEFKAREGNVK